MKHEKIYLHPGRTDVTLTCYALDDSKEMLAGKKRPGILICPGGGYLNCSDREAEPVALRFAAMGYHAFVLRYATYSGDENAFPINKKLERRERSVFPASMQDIGRAFLTLHKRAKEWLLDTQRIAICGFSAGAHNCALYAACWDQAEILGHFGGSKETFRPAACILGYGLYDYHMIMRQKADMKDPFALKLRDAACMALLGTDDPSDELLDAVSPARRLSATTPPMFLWATTEDTLVPVSQTANICLALAENGIPFEAHIFESGPHGLSLADQATASSKFETNTDAAHWITLAQQWLSKRFALPMEEFPAWMKRVKPGDRQEEFNA